MNNETVLTYDQIVSLIKQHVCDFDHVRNIEQAVLQSPEIQALRKDAERYRHVSKSESDGVVDICICRIDWSTGVRDVLTGDRAHALVDAAMEQKP